MGFGHDIGRKPDQTKGLRQSWTTPRELFDSLNKIFGFTVDACASADNALLPRYWSEQDDCRDHNWFGEVVFCNPPFGECATILPKVTQARAAVFLMPITSIITRYFAASPPQHIAIPAYRIKFVPPAGLECKTGPTLGTVLLLYRASEGQREQIARLGFKIY